MVTILIEPEILLSALMIIAHVWGIRKMILAMLEALGIRTLTMQSKHSQGERNAAVKKFNSATYPSQLHDHVDEAILIGGKLPSTPIMPAGTVSSWSTLSTWERRSRHSVNSGACRKILLIIHVDDT
ncbi:hypothetical protein FVEG_09266 [Fusarium verticillioides 7600]|uniref:Uncharacterized protein n=1 Tax=Gibberella moniliformis (strain M3125 / FGSC 7600) TaxID=334819 RepID=W7MQB9_GIBM7|nr:hypothetical protein FVEG_09266 [Fusarium verticillioides 7600]EWG49904.1 hypothetical protein FVEG_09266 [Fusarium verticillioides 7600]